ncbi:hypothetical protein ATE84_3826 [Aquimarina sp. MAR_2010_214]|uniref:hypothetical protein n=1 Tax=Aquimarina sp. MAR_2010_214 TaxID=1250026 RepID=UPI000CBEE08F|nr:hypothetical protein [Aquimarina sp. MAR_2010_214]PKV51728.1 hypothetical protein ATE84_3826 [Aquimarina sp. MAR_2010_214]
MLPDHINDIPPEVLYTILKVLGIDIGEFMYNLLNDSPQEIMTYTKIYSLYNMREQ